MWLCLCIKVVEDIPKNHMGKVDRRDYYWSGAEERGGGGRSFGVKKSGIVADTLITPPHVALLCVQVSKKELVKIFT